MGTRARLKWVGLEICVLETPRELEHGALLIDIPSVHIRSGSLASHSQSLGVRQSL